MCLVCWRKKDSAVGLFRKMKVEEIIAATRSRYSQLLSYEDEGEFEQESYGRNYRSTFRTAFMSKDTLLFETQGLKPDEPHHAPLEKFGARFLFRAGKSELRYSHAVGSVDLTDVAVHGILSSSHGIFRLVVPLLVPELSVRSVFDEKFDLLPNRSEKEDCYHIWCIAKRLHIWISKDDFTVRRFRQEHARSPFKQLLSESFKALPIENKGDLTAYFSTVRCNQPMQEKNFSFDDYVSEPVHAEAFKALMKKMFTVK